MATVTEDFTGTENPLSSGGKWDSGPGAWGAMQKDGNCFGATADSDDCARLATASPGADLGDAHYAQAAITGLESNGMSVQTRLASTTDGDGYSLHANSTNLRLFRIDDTGSLAFTQLGAAYSVITQGDTIRLESSGSTHDVKVNTVSQGTRTDATYTTGQPGCGCYHNTGRLDTWEGGDLAAAGVHQHAKVRRHPNFSKLVGKVA